MRTRSAAVTGERGNLAGATAEVTRLRLGLEGSRPFRFEGGAALTPSLEVGVRHDGGDAETGFGVDVGGSLAWADPARGLSAELSGRALIAHAEDGYREWGAGASVVLDPGADGRGLSLRLAPAWGTAEGGAERLWAGDAGALANLAGDDDTACRRPRTRDAARLRNRLRPAGPGRPGHGSPPTPGSGSAARARATSASGPASSSPRR